MSTMTGTPTSTSFTLHTAASAPAASRPVLEQLQKSLGFLPNLYATFAESPQVLGALVALQQSFEHTSLSATERQVVLLTTSFENDCTYCMAAHSVIAGMQKVPADVIASLRDGTPPADARLAALADFTRLVVSERGKLPEAAVAAFLEAGFHRQQVLEVALGVALKTLTNYVDHLAHPPLDKAFQAQAWVKPGAASCPSCATH